ncbi:hypothetical protein IAR55_001413 [Kwoniella newhampshirensis]|uniref:B30.2/SPRY domain-containing protein n=1 Tax=Kwoniella newhampshirensis TaxID=1651941 RepID=A0AAW0Z234_9TREE
MTTYQPTKKRRLSHTASSRSSTSTPAPVPIPDGNASLSALPDFSSSTTSSTGLAGPGPSTLEHQAQVAAQGKAVRDDVERRQFARLGTVVAGSGDGKDGGEECFLWTDIPVVKNFRYAPCTLSPNPSPHPLVPFYRTIPYPSPMTPVHISWLDRSAFLRLSHTALTMTNDRGFRSARANVAVREGTWYYEVLVERGNGPAGGGKGTGSDAGNAHVRIGWGRRECNVDAPVGSDGYSYAIRDVGGEKVHLSRPKPYGRSFATGDVIGCLITLPPRPSLEDRGKDDPATIKRQRRHFNYKGQSYFEMPEYPPSREMDAMVDREGKVAAATKAAAEAEKLGNGDGVANGSGKEANGGSASLGKGKKGATTKNTKKGKKEADVELDSSPQARTPATLEGSSVSFFLNGEPLGEAFTDLYDFTPLPPLYTPANHSGKKGNHLHPEKVEILHDDGTLGYYPMFSCFGKGKLKTNFGPDFAHPLQESIGARAMCERWDEFRAEEQKLDERDEAEDTKRLDELMQEERRERNVKLRADEGTPKKRKSMKKKKGVEVEQTPVPEGRGVTTSPPRSETAEPIKGKELPSLEEIIAAVKREKRERSASAPRAPAFDSGIGPDGPGVLDANSMSRSTDGTAGSGRGEGDIGGNARPATGRSTVSTNSPAAGFTTPEGRALSEVEADVKMEVDGDADMVRSEQGAPGSDDGQEGVTW